MTAHSLISGKRSRAFVKRGRKTLSQGNKQSQARGDSFFPSGFAKAEDSVQQHRLPTGVTECSDLLLPPKDRPRVSLHLNRFAKQMFDAGLSLQYLDRFAKRPFQKGLSLQRLDREFTKRLFDLIFSLLVLILFSPVYLLLTLLVALSSPGPIFYIQERVGKDYKRFDCIKFRTMVINADEMLLELMESPQIRQEFKDNFKLKQDPRITRIGRFLRLTSLDEFPQFWNVLKGDMSVVGPRPLVAEELPCYGRHIDKVLTTKPGITGLWQVSGRNDIPYSRRILIDVYYAKFHNFWLDLWIIIKTVGVVIVPKNNGAY